MRAVAFFGWQVGGFFQPLVVRLVHAEQVFQHPPRCPQVQRGDRYLFRFCLRGQPRQAVGEQL